MELLENGDESSLLAEALTTEGMALSWFRNKDRARAAFERAIQVAEQADDLESAGLAALALIEQLPESLSDDELFTILDRADKRLENTQNAALLRRQKNCFRRFASRILWPDWGSSLKESVHRHEARQIVKALEDTGGIIRRASRLLKLTPQGLQKILNKRQKDLRSTIVEIKRRKRESSLNENVSGGLSRKAVSEPQTVRILHVEDNEVVAANTEERLEIQGWHVETCGDGNKALEKITGNTHYDLLLVDYGLPGVNGIELVRRARQLAHRSHTPIIVLSATPVEAAARKAGADEFLQKPQGIGLLVETISRLLSENAQDS